MRVETGPMKFGDDWTGVFIRGDNAGGYALALSALLDGFGNPIVVAQLRGLYSLLARSNERIGHLSETQIMKPFEEATLDPARFTPVDKGKACGSAKE